ncbi:hypothetical protein D3C76_1599910 [compost metagenome]
MAVQTAQGRERQAADLAQPLGSRWIVMLAGEHLVQSVEIGQARRTAEADEA